MFIVPGSRYTGASQRATTRQKSRTRSVKMKIHPYIQFGGKCAEAFSFYKEHLGATNIELLPWRGSPAEQMAPPDWLDKILHASLTIDGNILMGTDGMPGQPFEGMKGCALSLMVNSEPDAERVFTALSQGGTVTMPLESTFFARKFGMLTDQFGVAWMVVCEEPR
jgi:PhnB protein